MLLIGLVQISDEARAFFRLEFGARVDSAKKPGCGTGEFTSPEQRAPVGQASQGAPGFIVGDL